MIEFDITNKEILSSECESNFISNEAGAFVTFAGRVRRHNEGKIVQALEYEVFTELAVSEGYKILQEAKSLFNLIQVLARHRQGLLQLGEYAVWIGVLSTHRPEAFEACRYIIDEIKKRLPIWKKEHYKNHPLEWVSCQHAIPQLSPQIYYSKQKRLIGNFGQERLSTSRVLIVGIGGLGCPAASSLASSGIGSISLCDGDRLELSNLHRQSLFSYNDIGKYKSDLAAKRLHQVNPFCKIKAICENINPQNIESLIQDHDLVLDCTDNFHTKILLHDHCVRLAKPLVQASIYAGTGLIQAFANFELGCMRCLWPENFDDNNFKTCIEAGVLGAQTGTLGSMQALQALNILLGLNSELLQFSLYIDLNDFNITKIRRIKNKDCLLHNTLSYPPSPLNTSSKVPDLPLPLGGGQGGVGVIILDLQADPVTTEDLIQLSSKNPTHKILVKCKHGIQSRLLVADLRQKGFTKIHVYEENNNLCSH